MLKQTNIESVLDKLEEAHARLSRGDEDSSIVDEAGHIAVHVARRATEDFFQALHDVVDVAPQLKGPKVYGTARDRAREYLRETSVEDNWGKEQVMQAVANLVRALKQEPWELFRIALAAKEVAILLLGPKRLGGVFAEWQTSTLGVGLLTWIEQQSLNLRVLGLTQKLDEGLAIRDAQKFELPTLSFVQMGCYLNIARTCFRAVAEDQCEGFSKKEVARTGSDALEKLDRKVVIDPGYRKHVLPKVAIEAAVLEWLGQPNDFWTRLSEDRARSILQEINETEPSEELRKIVLKSAVPIVGTPVTRATETNADAPSAES